MAWCPCDGWTDWKGSKCFAAFSLGTKSLTLICIYGDCNAILLFTSQKINLDFCYAFEIHLLVEASYIKTNAPSLVTGLKQSLECKLYFLFCNLSRLGVNDME